MRFPATVVGIDPSGDRIVAVAVGTGVTGRARPECDVLSAPLAWNNSRREEEASSLLAEFVREKGLAGRPAVLCVPAAKTYSAVLPFPRISGKDAQRAIAMEAFRVLPLPEESPFVHRWIGSGDASRIAVVAVERAYVDRWMRAISDAGLVPSRAVPSGLAVASFLHAAGSDALHVLAFRDAGGLVEHTAIAGGFPVSCSATPMQPSLSQALSDAASDGLADPVPGFPDPVVYAPAGWADLAGFPLETPVVEFPQMASCGHSEAGAYGSAISVPGMDLLSGTSGGILHSAGKILRVSLVSLTVLLLAAWPSAVAFKTRQEAEMLKKAVADLRPASERVQELSESIADAEERLALVAAVEAERNQPLAVLADLTERVPPNTWLTGFRMDGLKIEVDGFSPAAGDLFSILSRDGRFLKVEFAAPLTRQGDSLERFQIRAVYAPEGSGKAREEKR